MKDERAGGFYQALRPHGGGQAFDVPGGSRYPRAVPGSMSERARPDRFTRRWLAAGWLMVALVFAASLMPGPPALAVAHGDKLQHVGAYFVLTFWFAQIYRPRVSRMRTVAALIAMGIAIELLQGLTVWRSADLLDVVANACGVGLGWLAAPPRGWDAYARMRAWCEAQAGAMPGNRE